MPADSLTLEVVEGPDAGRQVALDRPLVIGRDPDTDLALEDGEVSRRHARVIPDSGSAVVEDLESANGTFVNHNELHGLARLDPGDQLQVGVTLIQLRSRQQIAAQPPTAIVAVPPALARAPQTPAYVNPEVIRAEAQPAPSPGSTPQLEKYLDVRVRRRAQLAPLALFVLVALALIIYFATR